MPEYTAQLEPVCCNETRHVQTLMVVEGAHHKSTSRLVADLFGIASGEALTRRVKISAGTRSKDKFIHVTPEFSREAAFRGKSSATIQREVYGV